MNQEVTDTSFKGQSSILSSPGATKPSKGGDYDYNRNLKQQHLSQTTQETSK